MPVITIRLTDDEERILSRRSRKAGVKKATLVRKLIRDQPYVTATDVLADMAVGRMRPKRDLLRDALAASRFRAHHAVMLAAHWPISIISIPVLLVSTPRSTN